MKKKISMISLGCPKNRVDAELMLEKLSHEFELTDDVNGSDLVIVNTCGFIDGAKQEAIDTVLELGQLKSEGKIKHILMTGCLSQRYPDEVLSELTELDGACGIGANGNIVAICKRILSGERVGEFPDKLCLPLSGKRLLSTPKHTAYLKIADGCSNCCTYCAIPMIRGKMRSRQPDDIVAEAKELAASGVRELILIAQDVTKYGVDIFKKPSLAMLLDLLCEIDGIEWIRLLYCYPDAVTDELIETVAKQDKVCKYIDLPLQHADATVLKRMNRTGDEKSLLELCKRLREKIPDVVLRTTLIAGFPGETEEQFETLSRFVNEAEFDRLGCFAYSAEDGTVAARLDGQLDGEVKNRRCELIMQQQSVIFERKQQEKIGRTFRVLVDGFDEENLLYLGRTYMDAPEIDSQVIISTEEELLPGELVDVKIISVCDFDLVGEVVK